MSLPRARPTTRGPAVPRANKTRRKTARYALETERLGTIDAIRIGTTYQTTYGTLWKDGTYFPRGTQVMVVGLHADQGYCVRFPTEIDGEPLETWEDWSETDFLADEGTVQDTRELSSTVLAEAREVLDEAEDGCHLHLHETDD